MATEESAAISHAEPRFEIADASDLNGIPCMSRFHDQRATRKDRAFLAEHARLPLGQVFERGAF